MTGKEFLKLSAIEVKDWVESSRFPITIDQVIKDSYRNRKILKWPTLKTRVGKHIQNLLILWVTFDDKTTRVHIRITNEFKFIVKLVSVYRNGKLIDSYDGQGVS